jgi:diadenosine tetraphosphate (Ap4A) HIT family hydrolase
MGNLDHLWAGWRSEFVTSGAGASREGEGPAACVFCAILSSGASNEETHVLWRHASGRAFAIVNAYPYTSGHLMIMPTRHVADLEDLGPDEASAVWCGVTAAVKVLKASYKPDGINLGANLGVAAGAGVPDHFHIHVLPRWAGDTNFMTSVADARVLPEPLSESAAKLRTTWSELDEH